MWDLEHLQSGKKKKGFKPQMFLLLLYVDDENVWIME
jgi:hypothetical protein